MNAHDATEIAFKNGYALGKAEGVKEIFEEIEGALVPTVSALFMIGETLVDVSKSHVSEEKAIKDIRKYLHNAISSRYQLKNTFAELKKKYTESSKEIHGG